MTDDVARLVLADNIAQNELLGMSRADAPQMLGVHSAADRDLRAHRGLDRELEALPDRRRRSTDVHRTGPG